MVRTNKNLEVIVQVLAYVASQFCRHDSCWRGIVGMNPKINSASRIENPHLRPFRGKSAFLWLSLSKIGDWFGGLPKWVLQSPVQFWGTVDAHSLRLGRAFLRNRTR